MTILAGHHTLLQVLTPSRGLPPVPGPWHHPQEQRSVIRWNLKHNNNRQFVKYLAWILILHLTCLKKVIPVVPPVSLSRY